jgi:peptidoglycan/LPS O-acetylase OafA/YrhL
MTTRRADIQGLRAVAVLLVVLYHAGLPALPGGYVGVDVFFVISGYVITGMLWREIEHTGRVDLASFYARRIGRLLPAALAMTAVTVVFFWSVYSPLERLRLATGAFASAVYLSNLWFALDATDYFATDIAGHPLLHTWSLSVEEQFYLVWPWLLMLAAAGSVGAARGRRVLRAVGWVALASLVACVVLTATRQPWAFFASPTRAWEFAAGAAAVLLQRRGAALAARPRLALGIAGAAAVLASAMAFSVDSPVPGWWMLLPVAGTAGLLWAGTADGAVQRLLGLRPMVWLGDVSYSWYLWHWPVLIALRELLPAQRGLAAACGVAASLLLAWGSYRLLEDPIRHHRALRLWPRGAIVAGLGLSLLAASALLVGREDAKQLARTPAYAPLRAPTHDRDVRAGCHATIPQTEVPASGCAFGDRASSTLVVLFGDSHAQHWFPAMEQAARQEHWQLVALTKSTCPSAQVEPFVHQLRRYYAECITWRERAMARILALKPDLVVLSNASEYADARLPDGRDGDPDSVWRAGLSATLQRFDAAGVRTLVLRDTPRPPFDVPVCLARAVARGADARACRFDARKASDPALHAIELEATREARHASAADLTEAICPQGSCAALQDGVVHYADGNHLTARYSASLAPALVPYLEGALREPATTAAAPPAGTPALH